LNHAYQFQPKKNHLLEVANFNFYANRFMLTLYSRYILIHVFYKQSNFENTQEYAELIIPFSHDSHK